MMKKEKLQEQLGEYILDTVKYIETVKEFCERESKWTLQRKSELRRVKYIKDRADQITLKFDHVQKAEDKAKAFGEYMWSGLTQVTADSRSHELEKELGEVLKKTLEGLEKLQHFLDAVEKLAVTSLFVFKSQRLMPMGVCAKNVCSVISAARIVSPLLIHFKRNAKKFFLPSLSNVDVLALQLDKYIHVTQQICEKMFFSHHEVKTNCFTKLWLFLCGLFGVLFGGNHEWKNGKLTLKFRRKSEESVKKLDKYLIQLIKIRMDESFRLTFVFGANTQHFINLFSERRSRMFAFLSDLEKAAVELDNMKKGSNISTVAGSSVGIAGGVLSIVGLALAPVTAVASLALTLTGVGLGVTSGVNSLVTGITEMAVNSHQMKNANNIFIRFMEDVQKIQGYMKEVARVEGPIASVHGVTVAFVKLAACARAVGKGIGAIVDGVSAVKVLRSEEVIAKAVNMGLQEANAGRSIPKLVADLPDIGQLAKGTPLAISKSARAGFITLNALFIGVDIFSIVNSGISLTKGSKNEEAQLIRSRSVMWRVEVKAWEKIYNHLCKGITGFYKNLEILEQPLYF
ncbi:apolipoprotein L3 isoform X2 [Ictalurus punctatus]|uniref:Apolipoprotein L3 isoform X2 n=1 Tax=Ictalurus punctatus TaxID=7998 RepID=A0A2D0SLA2_ICTPU|nr:apolipoprotein L3 isoform X2 [Ictalurus punctatus]